MLYNYNEAIKLYGTDYKLKKPINQETKNKMEKGKNTQKKENNHIDE